MIKQSLASWLHLFAQSRMVQTRPEEKDGKNRKKICWWKEDPKTHAIKMSNMLKFEKLEDAVYRLYIVRWEWREEARFR